MLEIKDHAISAGEKQRNPAEANTNWRTETRQCQEGRRGLAKQRHLHTEEQRPGNVSRGDPEQQSRGAHILESRDQVMSAGEKQSNQGDHSLSGKQRPGNVSRAQTEEPSRGKYKLENTDQAMSAEET